MNSGSRPLTREFRLLVETCRGSFSEPDRQALARLVEQAEWNQFLALSRRHRVQGLVWHELKDFASAIPGEVAGALAKDAASVAEHNLRAAQLSRALRTCFSAAAIPLLFVKGLTLSKLAYGDAFLKMGWDIDILIPPEAVNEAAKALEAIGFRLVVPPPNGRQNLVSKWHRRRKESVWRSPDGLHVELHTRLADNPALIPSVGIRSGWQRVEVAPGIELPTLTFDDLFAYLCVHGASSAWFRLKWIADLSALLASQTHGRLEPLLEHSQRLGAGRAADQALLLASRLFGIGAEDDLIQRLQRSRGSRWLADTAFDQLLDEREPTEVPLGTIPIHLTQLFLRREMGYKLRESTRQLFDWASSIAMR